MIGTFSKVSRHKSGLVWLGSVFLFKKAVTIHLRMTAIFRVEKAFFSEQSHSTAGVGSELEVGIGRAGFSRMKREYIHHHTRMKFFLIPDELVAFTPHTPIGEGK
jgi:hypothetical protein